MACGGGAGWDGRAWLLVSPLGHGAYASGGIDWPDAPRRSWERGAVGSQIPPPDTGAVGLDGFRDRAGAKELVRT
jgi:hypothetical protein